MSQYPWWECHICPAIIVAENDERLEEFVEQHEAAWHGIPVDVR